MLSDGGFKDWNINAVVGKMEEVLVSWLFHEIAPIRSAPPFVAALLGFRRLSETSWPINRARR